MPGSITVWEKDPAVGGLTTAPIPDVGKLPLAFNFPAAPPYSSNTATADFRYWNAAATLRRAADFWAASMQPPVEWNGSAILDVYLDRGVALQSKYDGQALNFYHGSPAETRPSSSIPAQVLICFVTNSVTPFWMPSVLICSTGVFWRLTPSIRSFGDMSAILCALQVPTFLLCCARPETGQNFWSSSSLSRIAPQFGAACAWRT